MRRNVLSTNRDRINSIRPSFRIKSRQVQRIRSSPAESSRRARASPPCPFMTVRLWRTPEDPRSRLWDFCKFSLNRLSVFFAQSSLAHLDMMVCALTLWGLAMYVERRPVATIVFLALAPLAKETAIVTPLALLAWELLCPVLQGDRKSTRLN